MKVNKVDKIQFIYNGKQNIIKITFYDYSFDNIPIFISDCVDEYIVMQLIDNSIIIIVNDIYINNCNKELLEIGIFDKLLRYELNTEQDSIIDVHLTRWFSSSSTIQYINNSNMDDEHKNKRISFIENYLLCNNNFNIHDKQYIANNLKFIEINELET